ncbi:sigma-54-dependent Fis family transcriptional regulator [Pseudonocardia sp.]|uniref:sigma-54-dependent Fis family transcriptional regulator n=1 Tax=Pseudonocardia sp. TaxID=60912 RepID=UPI003D0EDCD1
MDDLADRRFLLAAARAEFLDGADARLRGVPDHVAASWRRSVSSGVRPDVVNSDYHTDLDFDSRLVRCARPVIDQLVEQLHDLPVCVALTDERARLLARRDSSSWFGRIADRVYFARGFDYAEGAMGTNGVGTVLEFGESVHIVGAEHFVDALQPFACAGAPVRDPLTGRIAGVLDISCLSDHSTPLMRSLVRSAAAQIEHNLLTDRDLAQRALFDLYARLDARSRQAVLAVGQRTVVANAPLQNLLVPDDREALQDHVRFLMQRRPTVDDRVDLPSGARVRLRGSTVTVGDDVAGMVGVVTILDETDVVDVAGPAVSAPRGGRQPSIRVDAVPSAPVPGSACPALRSAAATVESSLLAGSSVLVIGEPGSGRFTLLAQVHRLVHDGGRAVALEAEQVEAAPQDAVARLRRCATGPTLPVLRDIDRLTAGTVEMLVDALADEPGSPVLAATAGELRRVGPEHNALLSWFGASTAVPALRNRSSDLPALVGSLLAELAPHREVRLSREAMRLVGRYGWPGNVRQLREALAAALRRRPVGCIEPGDLPEYCQSMPRGELRAVDRAERDTIVAALREAGGNRVTAAAALGLARSTLYRKIQRYGITD